MCPLVPSSERVCIQSKHECGFVGRVGFTSLTPGTGLIRAGEILSVVGLSMNFTLRLLRGGLDLLCGRQAYSVQQSSPLGCKL